MSKQQELIMEAESEAFNIITKYHNALPRSTHEESHALDLKLIQRGQQVPIIVNEDMDILDGYTRHDLLAQRGKRIKYQIMKFPDKASEYEFVVETNVMKRQLTPFQRVEAMYGFFLQTKLDRRLLNREAHFDIFKALSKGAVTTKDIMKLTKYSKKTIHRLCEELSESNWISRESKVIKSEASGGKVFGVKTFCFKLLPKGFEALEKSKPRALGSSIDLLGQVVGLGINRVHYAVQIIKSGNKVVIDKCRRGTISLHNGFALCYPTQKISRKGETHEVWKSYSRIKCPNCGGIHERKEYSLVR